MKELPTKDYVTLQMSPFHDVYDMIDYYTWRSPSTRGSRPLGRAPPSQRRGGGSHVCCPLHPPQV